MTTLQQAQESWYNYSYSVILGGTSSSITVSCIRAILIDPRVILTGHNAGYVHYNLFCKALPHKDQVFSRSLLSGCYEVFQANSTNKRSIAEDRKINSHDHDKHGLLFNEPEYEVQSQQLLALRSAKTYFETAQSCLEDLEVQEVLGRLDIPMTHVQAAVLYLKAVSLFRSAKHRQSLIPVVEDLRRAIELDHPQLNASCMAFMGLCGLFLSHKDTIPILLVASNLFEKVLPNQTDQVNRLPLADSLKAKHETSLDSLVGCSQLCEVYGALALAYSDSGNLLSANKAFDRCIFLCTKAYSPTLVMKAAASELQREKDLFGIDMAELTNTIAKTWSEISQSSAFGRLAERKLEEFRKIFQGRERGTTTQLLPIEAACDLPLCDYAKFLKGLGVLRPELCNKIGPLCNDFSAVDPALLFPLTFSTGSNKQFIFCDHPFCQKLGLWKCDRCKAKHYCGVEHQRSDWKAHKAFCKSALTSTNFEF